MRWFVATGVGLVLMVPPRLPAQDSRLADRPVAFRGARIHTAVDAPINNGILVIHRGKIIAVGPAEQVPIPHGADVRDVQGKVLIPGLVDTHSHIGIFTRPGGAGGADGNELSGPIQPALRALDAINPDDPGIRMAVAGGITTANIMPGSGNVIGGQTLYVKLRGNTIEAMRIPNASVLGGLKMANGENPKGYGRRGNLAPVTRMKIAALQREQFIKAREYQQKWVAYRKGEKKGLPPETDIALEPLVEVLERKRTVHFHCHRADDLLTALRLAEEFNFEIVLQHATEAYRVVDELLRRKVPVSLTLVDSPGGKMEVAALLEENAAVLDKAGVKVAINTDDPITESRFYLRTGAIAVRGGMSEEAALRAMTLHPAQMLHLDGRLGSLEIGKDADFVVLSGPPFSIYTQVLETYIDGVRVFDRNDARQRSYQTGGFALSEPLPSTGNRPAKPLPPAAAVNGGSLPEGTRQFVVHAGRLHTASGPTIVDGAVLVEDGTIRYAGPRAGLPPVPATTPILKASDVTPGLIDAHAVVGLSGMLNIPADQDQDEASDPNQADVRVLDSFNPNEPFLQFVRENGVTVVHATPGRVNVIAGQTALFRTHGRNAEQMALRSPAGLLVNLGETPKQSYPNRLPTTRMGTAALLRTALTKAQNYVARKTTAEADKLPPLDLKSEALALALDGKIPVFFSAHRADDIDTALRLAREFKLRAVLNLATEAYRIPEVVKGAGVPVVLHPTMQRIASLETFNTYLGNAALLAEWQIPIALGTAFEGYVPKTRVLRHEAAVAMVNGLGFDRALRAITLDTARLLGIDDRFGSLEAGKVADLVLYDGDPFEHATHVTHTIIGGRVVYDRAEYLKLPFERRALPLTGSGGSVGCCLGIW